MVDDGRGLFDERLIARRRLRRWATATAGLLLLIRLGAHLVPMLRAPDLLLLDAWQSLRATRRPSPQVVIVAIDDKSIQRFGPPAWPRNEYVPLVERLSAAGAKVIGFDFTFASLEREAANSQLFAEAMKKAGNVVFGYEFTDVGDPSPAGAPPSEPVRATALEHSETELLPPAPRLIEPEPALAQAAAAVGHVRTVAGDDGKVRVLPLLIQHGGKAYPSLALELARVFMGLPANAIHATSGAVSLGVLDIPVSPSGEVLLGWPAAGEQAFPQYSFLDVVRGDVKNEAFQGKAVLIAGTASGLDDRDFPFAVEAPGVMLYATFLDNTFRYDFVRAPVWAWLLEWGLFAVALGLGVWLLPRLTTRVLLTTFPLLVLLLLGSAGFLYVQRGVWLQVVYPTLALLAPLGVVTVLRLTASEREVRDVAAEKEENQKLLGLSFQEKGMLDMALATFNKLPFTQDLKLVYLNLGVDFENRSQRDKAYLVYKKVFDVDPRFEDVAQRMERLIQAGAGSSLWGAPTGQVGSTAVPPMTHRPPATAGRSIASPTAAPPLDRALAASLPPIPYEDFPEPGEAPTELAPTARPYQQQATLVEGSLHTPATQLASDSAPTKRAPPTVGTGPGAHTPAPGGQAMPGMRFGRYQVERHLGRGGMGDVYLVRDTVINRQAALKTIRPDTDLDARQLIEMRQRFYREAQTAGQLSSPHIVTVYDVGEDLGVSYIVMEFVEGQTLTQWMKKQRFNLPQIKHVIYHAALGLDFAHGKGVFHRDVKPDNIMLSNLGAVKVMDFGIARVVESSLTRTGSVMGTPAYMSPEQVNGLKVDGRSDIFSLGVILYELLTGRKPFRGDTMSSLLMAIMKEEPPRPSSLETNVHGLWDAIVGKALAKDRTERYATAKEFGVAVRDAAAR
jgi:CHASE2 domain-containing sensor protein/tRNA A-37 threonylcarbamoyl transferase component Bud32